MKTTIAHYKLSLLLSTGDNVKVGVNARLGGVFGHFEYKIRMTVVYQGQPQRLQD